MLDGAGKRDGVTTRCSDADRIAGRIESTHEYHALEQPKGEDGPRLGWAKLGDVTAMDTSGHYRATPHGAEHTPCSETAGQLVDIFG